MCVVELTSISDIFLLAMKTCAGKSDLFRECYAHLWENLQSFHVNTQDEWDFWELLATEQWKQNPEISFHDILVGSNRDSPFLDYEKIPNILGSIILHNHQPGFGVLNTAQLFPWKSSTNQGFEHCSTSFLEA